MSEENFQSAESQLNFMPTLPSTRKLTPALFHQKSISVSLNSSKSRRPFRPLPCQILSKRAIFKNGDCNVKQSLSNTKKLRYLQDIPTTLIDLKWRWTLLIFSFVFAASFYGFGLIWWYISLSHGDLEPEHLPPLQRSNNWTPCVTEIYNFTSAFLFSVETQITTGYGGRSITEECLDAIIVMCIQSVVGMMLQAFMIGLVYTKLTRPKSRTQTLLFSKCAVVCMRDGELCLMFRVGDLRKSHIIEASIRAQLVTSRTTGEGEILNNHQTELRVFTDDGSTEGDLFFIWPLTIVHIIDKWSPFYYLSASDMLQKNFEILIVLEGTIESTGQKTQARSSYLSSEILWGHVFEPVVNFNKEFGTYEVNYSKFDRTIPIDTPLYSAAEIEEYRKFSES